MIYYYEMHHCFFLKSSQNCFKFIEVGSIKRAFLVTYPRHSSRKNINTILQISTFINCFIINEVRSIKFFYPIIIPRLSSIKNTWFQKVNVFK